MSFPPLATQLDALRQDTLEILPEEDLVRKLERSARTGRPLVVKQGFDPTRPDLHLGHAVSLRKLRTFQELGHQVVFVVGDYTALIGDPTGRSEMRPRLTEDEVTENARTYTDQVFKILDPARTRVAFNASWLRPLPLAEVLQLTAHSTVARMLERDDFARRYTEKRPLSVVEFLYPLLQAYDSVALRADVEIGGTDQKFNLLLARDVQSRYGQEPQVCLLMPLMRGTDGVHKMSKSRDNYVGISDTPDEQYGRTLSIPDEMLEEWYRLGAALPERDLDLALERIPKSPYAAKRALAERIVTLYHGVEAGRAASETFERVFRRREVPENLPVHEIGPDDDLRRGEVREVPLTRLLVHVGLASSHRDAIRQIEQGAVSLDGRTVSDRETRIPTAGETVLRKGKRHFARIRFRPTT